MRDWINPAACCGMLMFLIGLPAAPACAAAPANTTVLETATSRLVIDRDARTIASLESLAPRRSFLSATSPAPLYTIQLAEPAATVAAKEAATVREGRDGDAVTVTAEHQNPVPLTVTIRFTRSEAGLILGRIQIESPQPIRIQSVRFPVLTVKLPLSGTGEQDGVLVPYCDGQLVQNPLKNGVSTEAKYPGVASMQLLAAMDRTGGVYLASQDAQVYSKTLYARRRADGVDLSLLHAPEQSPLTRWALPYDVAITTFPVDANKQQPWEAAAEVYRAWAEQQPWCSQTVKQRVASGDLPKWLTDPSLFYCYTLRGMTAESKNKFVDRTPLVVPQAQAWQAALGAPVTYMIQSWEKRGSWVTPDYFPPYGGTEAFTAMTRALHAAGNHTMVFLSGLKWTLHKTERNGTPPVDDQAAFDARGRTHAIADAAGEPLITGKPEQDVGQFAEVCPATPLAREILGGVVRQCQEHGLDCVQVDQVVGGGTPFCYNPKHGHAPGGGNWAGKAVYALFEQVRREARARDKNFAFAIEEPGEYFLPLLDTCHTRDYAQHRWPRDGKGVVGVPLFTHVYHDYLLGYGGDSAQVSEKPAPQANYHQGMNLVCGKLPAVSVWTRPFDPSKTDPVQIRLLRGHMDLLRSADGREFLLFGRRLPSPALNVPQVSMPFVSKKGDRETMEFPSVLHATYRAADGRVASVYVCIGTDRLSFKTPQGPLTLEPGEVKLVLAQR